MKNTLWAIVITLGALTVAAAFLGAAYALILLADPYPRLAGGIFGFVVFSLLVAVVKVHLDESDRAHDAVQARRRRQETNKS